MFFLKLLCTLCTLVSTSTPYHHTPASTIAHATVLIPVPMGDTVIHSLCVDFPPNITNTTCEETFFEASEKLNFMEIYNQTMQLSPSPKDGACYYARTSICFQKTYDLTISALNASDHSLIVDKQYTIVVQSYSADEVETVIVIFVALGSSMACVVSCCLEQLCRELRRWAVGVIRSN